MKIKELGHLAFKCQDLQASVAFYQDVLGFEKQFALYYGDIVDGLQQSGASDEEIARWLPRYNDPWIIYMKVTDRLFIELFDALDATRLSIPDEDHFNYQHLSLIVEDIMAARDELVEKGVPVDVEPNLGMDSTWQMWSHDPDGNKIEFMQYTEKSMQLVGRSQR